MMKQLRWLFTGAIFGAGLAAFLYEQRLQTARRRTAARLQALEQDNATLQAALDKATYIPKPTKRERAASMQQVKREVAWSLVPDWLEMTPEARQERTLELARYGMADSVPDAEMIEEYKRLEAAGELNPDDFFKLKELSDENYEILFNNFDDDPEED